MDFLHQIVAFANDHGLSTIISLIAAQFVLAVAVAIKGGEFQLDRLTDVFRKSGPLVLGYIACDLLIKNPELTTAVFGLIIAQVTGEIAKKLVEIYPALGNLLPDAVLSKKSA